MMVDGQLSDPWARYFQHVVTPYFERLLNLEDMEILDWSNNRQKDHERRLAEMEKLIQELWQTNDKGFTKRLEDLENSLQFVDGPKDATLLRKLDDLEALIFSVLIPHPQNTDTALGAIATKNPPIDADKAIYRDSTASDALVTSTWLQIKAFLKTYFDTLYNLYVHPNHSGEVTSVADGAQTIANDAVTYAKMQNVSATDKILGRATAGAGDVEEIACTAAGRALIDDANTTAQIATLGMTSLMDDSMADALHRHSELSASDGTPNPALSVDASGDVGIGTVAPQRALHVVNAGAGSASGIVSEHAANQYMLMFHDGSDPGFMWETGDMRFGTVANYDGAGYSQKMVIQNDGNVGINQASPVISGTGKLHMTADTLRLDTARTPASAGAVGNTGETCWDADYLYICINTNTWHRATHATW